LSAAAISNSSACASVSSAPKANINGSSTKTVIASVKISELELRPMRRGRRALHAERHARDGGTCNLHKIPRNADVSLTTPRLAGANVRRMTSTQTIGVIGAGIQLPFPNPRASADHPMLHVGSASGRADPRATCRDFRGADVISASFVAIICESLDRACARGGHQGRANLSVRAFGRRAARNGPSAAWGRQQCQRGGVEAQVPAAMVEH
jgi:hypothetical protein